MSSRFVFIIFVTAACASDITPVSLAPDPGVTLVAVSDSETTEPAPAAPVAAAPSPAATPDPATPSLAPPVRPEQTRGSTQPEAAAAQSRPAKATDEEPDRATITLATPDGKLPTSIPPGGKLSGMIAVPLGKPGRESVDSDDIQTTLRYPDTVSDIVGTADQNYCFVDAQHVVVLAAIPTLVRKGSISHMATIMWTLECRPGEDRECAGTGVRPFAQDGDVQMDLVDMTGLRVAERTRGRVVVKWGKNEMTVDAEAGHIILRGGSLKGGFAGDGGAVCVARRPPPMTEEHRALADKAATR